MPINSFDDYPMSWRPVLEHDGSPMYRSLARQLERDIESGALLPGTRLPPQRELADYLDINLSTVSRAFKLCTDKGLLSGSVGDGTYVSYSSLTRLTAEPKDRLIRLDAMTPETIEQDELIAILRKMLSETEYIHLFQYENTQPEWKSEAACRLLKRAGCTAQAHSILTAGGGQNAIACLFAGLLKRGDKLGVDPLTYPGVKTAAKLFGIQLVPIEHEDGCMSTAALRSAIKNGGVRAIFVMPDYQNPTANIMSTKNRRRIADTAIENDLLIIEDGICKLLSDGSCSIHDLAPKNTVFSLSLSKTISPALRTAYIAAPERYYKPIQDALDGINLTHSALLSELGARLIASEQLDALLKRRAEGIEKRNKMVDIILKDFTVRGDSHALARWLVLPDGISGAQLEEEAEKRGVCVYGAEHFAVGKSIPEAGARLAICSPQSMDELEYALNVIKGILSCTQF